MLNTWTVLAAPELLVKLFKESVLLPLCYPSRPPSIARSTASTSRSNARSSDSDGRLSPTSDYGYGGDNATEASACVYRICEETCNSSMVVRYRNGEERHEHLIDVICVRSVTIAAHDTSTSSATQTVTVRKLHNAEGKGTYVMRPGTLHVVFFYPPPPPQY